jgi:transposase-like protein
MQEDTSAAILERDTLLRALREARFADGVRCVRCHSNKVGGWGRFSGRYRYRCRSCKRTFSDLTGTAAAYTKKLDRWRTYEACMANACSVREAAKETGIHPSTSFRWRHAILRTLTGVEQVELYGIVELLDKQFRYSEKGQSKRKVPPRNELGILLRQWFRRRTVNVTVACSRTQQVFAAITGAKHVRLEELQSRVLPCLRSADLLMSVHGLFGTYARAARSSGIKHESVRRRGAAERGEHHIENARLYTRTLVAWLRRFRGVATSYLPHYLLWHRQTYRCGHDEAAAAMRVGREAPIPEPRPVPLPKEPIARTPIRKLAHWIKAARRHSRFRETEELESD